MPQQQTSCPRCAKRQPSAARFCRRCGMGLRPASFDRPAGPPVEPASAGGADVGAGLPPVPEYRPAAKPKSRKRPAVAGRAKASAGSGGGKGGWLWIVGIIFVVRACINSGPHHADVHKPSDFKSNYTPPSYRAPTLPPVAHRPAWRMPGDPPAGAPDDGWPNPAGPPRGVTADPWKPDPADPVLPARGWRPPDGLPHWPSRPDPPDPVGDP